MRSKRWAPIQRTQLTIWLTIFLYLCVGSRSKTQRTSITSAWAGPRGPYLYSPLTVLAPFQRTLSQFFGLQYFLSLRWIAQTQKPNAHPLPQRGPDFIRKL